MKTMSRSPKAKTRIQFSKNLLFFGHFLFGGTAHHECYGIICLLNMQTFVWVSTQRITDWPTRWSWNVWRDQQGSDRESQLTKRTASVWPSFGLITPCAVSTSNSELFIEPDHVQTISMLSNFYMQIRVSQSILVCQCFLFSPSALLNQPTKKEFPLT